MSRTTRGDALNTPIDKNIMDPLLNGEGVGLVTKHAGEAQLLKAFFALVFIDEISIWESLTQKGKGMLEYIPLVKEDWVRRQLGKGVIYKSMGPEGMHPVVMEGLVDTAMRTVTVIFERSR